VIEILPGFIEIVVLVFCLIDCIQTDAQLIRNLPKIAWIVLIVVIPVVGGIAWFVAGRPPRDAQAASVPWRATRTAGFPEHERPGSSSSGVSALTEIDERLQRDLDRVDREHEEALRRWEASLREREQRLGKPDATGALE
jgi:hypothetical protein